MQPLVEWGVAVAVTVIVVLIWWLGFEIDNPKYFVLGLIGAFVVGLLLGVAIYQRIDPNLHRPRK